MKRDIHPPYYQAKVTCSHCGTKYTLGSTLPSFEIEVCAACHPYFSGQAKFMDTTGRIDRFRERLKKSAQIKGKKKKG